MTGFFLKKKKSGFLGLFLLCCTHLYAQKTELGGLIGPTYYWGDIVNNIELSNVKLGGSFFVRYHYTPRVAFRANLSYARVTGADSVTGATVWQTNRNLSFWTHIVEASGVVEYNILRDENTGRKINNRGIPYVYGGLAVFYFNPKATNPISGKEVALQPLQLNGVSYSRVALSIPIGLGYRYYLNRNWQVGFEFGLRYSLSSYIDDVGGKSIYPKLESLNGDDARVLWSPSPKRLGQIQETGSTYVGGPEGKERGKNEWVSDVYFLTGITVSYRLWPGENTRSPRIH